MLSRPGRTGRYCSAAAANHRKKLRNLVQCAAWSPRQPVEIAPLYVTLAAEENSYTSGQVWCSDGGPEPSDVYAPEVETSEGKASPDNIV